MIGFITFVKKEGNVIGGLLVTDNELSPKEFIYTEEIKPMSKFERILYGANYEMKCFGDLIAGTLYTGIKESETLQKEKIDAIFVSDKRMLNLRRNADIPVAYLEENDKLTVAKGYDNDIDIIGKSLAGIINHNNFKEVFERIGKAIVEKINES